MRISSLVAAVRAIAPRRFCRDYLVIASGCGEVHSGHGDIGPQPGPHST